MNTIDPGITGKKARSPRTIFLSGTTLQGLDSEGPLVVSPSKAMRMLDCGRTRLYELLGRGELESYRDGKSRKITVASIRARIHRKLEEARTA
jgi:hypothetical protein